MGGTQQSLLNPGETLGTPVPQSTDTSSLLRPGESLGTPVPKPPTAPTATLSRTPTASDMPMFGEPGINTPIQRLTMPLAKALVAVHDKLKDIEAMNSDNKEAPQHPIQAKIGDVVQNIEELLLGGQAAGKSMGTSSGVLNNPVSAAILPGGEAEPALAGGLREAGSLIKGAGEAFRGTKAAASADEAVNAVEAARTKAVGAISEKANVPQGTSATEEIPATTNKAQAPTPKSTSPQTMQAIRDHATQIANQEGLKPPSADLPIREVYQDQGFQFLDRAQAKYQEVEEKTGVNISKETNDIRILSDKIRDIGDDDPEKAGMWEQQKLAKENKVQAAFDAVPSAGQAKADWIKGNSALDMNNHVVASTSGRVGIGSGEAVDATKLAPRLERSSLPQSRTQPGRLQQLGGTGPANKLLDSVETQRSAIKDFVPTETPAVDALPSTDQQALKEIIPVKAGKLWGVNTNWNKALEDFDNLGPDVQKARFSNPSAVRNALRSEATKQNLLMGLGSLAAAEETIRRIFFRSQGHNR